MVYVFRGVVTLACIAGAITLSLHGKGDAAGGLIIVAMYSLFYAR